MEDNLNYQILENLSQLADAIISIRARLDLIETKPIEPATVSTQPSASFPPFPTMKNCECTIFNNGRSRGRTQYKAKVEINTSSDTFAGPRDHEGWAELCDPLAMRGKIFKRNITDDFRHLTTEVLDQYDTAAGLKFWIGMFSVKGGRSGLVWVDRQLIMVFHNQFKPLYADMIIGEGIKRLSDFDVAAHPITRKPFAQPKTSTIIGKSIDIFGENE